ncbi:hypothetical protein BOX15_Mlig016001g1 [Macrostomum lignano]|uniref:ABC transporter domain-containing protein n=1 Tax=Macrostomum lignano TaxID=282301 RepID=A0A267FJW2_9PLAT|nr:hypothetical protein BOX15_Mlig016001g1 [Macrostomum lignano]
MTQETLQQQQQQQVLTVRGVNLTVEGGRQILHNVHLTAKSGSMLAVMGPSGSGKTSLMNLICGRRPPSSTMDGEILLNNRKVTSRMRKSFGYVTQEDVFFSQLTLKQTLWFFSQVKLPSSMTAKDKEKRVNEVVELLQLTKCLDTKIGGMSDQGLSGGEKKRANIACELLRNPKVLLLDEPTSGLDSSLALKLMEILGRWVVEQSSIVVTSIHQPSSQTFHEFHELLLLADGQIAYSGRRELMVEYFEGIGVPFHKHWNAADFMLEVVKESSQHKAHILENGRQFAERAKQEQQQLASASASQVHLNLSYQADAGSRQNGLAGLDEGSVRIRFTSPDFSPQAAAAKLQDDSEGVHLVHEVSWWTQFLALSYRGFLVSREAILSVQVLVQTAFVAFIVSVLWFQVAKTENNIADFISAIFFLTSYVTFAPFFEAIMTFYADLAIVRHERKSGMYRIGAYYLAKMVVEIPLLLVVPIFIIAPAYWCVGFADFSAFAAFLVVITLNSLASQGIGIVFSLLSTNPRTNMTFAFIYMIFCFLTGGFFTKSIPFWFDWAKYLSYIRYCYHFGLIIILERTDDFRCGEPSLYAVCNRNSTAGNSTAPLTIPGSVILELQPDTILPVWANIIVTVCMFFAFRLLGYVILRFCRKV